FLFSFVTSSSFYARRRYFVISVVLRRCGRALFYRWHCYANFRIIRHVKYEFACITVIRDISDSSTILSVCTALPRRSRLAWKPLLAFQRSQPFFLRAFKAVLYCDFIRRFARLSYASAGDIIRLFRVMRLIRHQPHLPRQLPRRNLQRYYYVCGFARFRFPVFLLARFRRRVAPLRPSSIQSLLRPLNRAVRLIRVGCPGAATQNEFHFRSYRRCL